MDKVRYTSLKFKVWEDKFYKIEKQMSQLHLDEIKVDVSQKSKSYLKVSKYKLDQNNLSRKDSHFYKKDATEFYTLSQHSAKKPSKHLDENEFQNADLIAECYIGFAKLLNDEMRAFDIKDSALFDTLKVTSFANKNLSGSGGKTQQPEEERKRSLTAKESSDALVKSVLTSTHKQK